MKKVGKCTNEGYCEGQGRTGACKTLGFPERLACPYLQRVPSSPLAKIEIDTKKPGPVDPDAQFPYGVSQWVVQELIKKRRT